MQMVCGEAQAGAAAAESATRRPSGASDGGQPSRCWRRSANRKRWAAIQPVDSSMVESAIDEVGRGGGGGQRGQRGAQRFGLRAKTAQPELAALIGHRRGAAAAAASVAPQQTRDEKQRDHGEAGAQVGQRELRQQRHGAAAGLAQDSGARGSTPSKAVSMMVRV